jgi:uncharacterized membrane protein YhaH (DUF805 family)
VHLIRLFASPDGRITRAMFWLGWLILLAVELAGRLALGLPLLTTPADSFSLRLLNFLIDAVLLYPGAVLMVKRMHDRNLSGQLIGFLIVPYSVLMLTNLLGMSGDPDQMGFVETILVLATGITAIAFLVDLGFRRGTAGPNRYGPEPRKAST